MSGAAVPPAPAPAQALDGAVVPVIPRGVRLRHCDVRGAWFLLAPERAVKLDAIAAHILQAVDGARSLDGVIDHLAAAFAAPRAQIARDVTAFLIDMRNRRMVELR